MLCLAQHLDFSGACIIMLVSERQLEQKLCLQIETSPELVRPIGLQDHFSKILHSIRHDRGLVTIKLIEITNCQSLLRAPYAFSGLCNASEPDLSFTQSIEHLYAMMKLLRRGCY